MKKTIPQLHLSSMFIPVRNLSLFIALCFTILESKNSFSQNLSNSPYSRFGIGEQQFSSFTPQLAMGGIGNAFTSPTVINNVNPASYTSLKLTTFQVGLSSVLTQQKSTQKEQLLLNNNFQFLSLAFPLSAKAWGASIGLVPFSAMGYNLSDSIMVDGQQVTNKFTGSGGINEFYIGNAIKPFALFSDSLMNNFSIGFNASYLFGNTLKVRKQVYDEGTNYLNLREQSLTNYNGWKFKFGINHKFNLKKDMSISIGGFYSLHTEIKSTRSLLAETYLQEGRYEVVRDTVNYSLNKDDKTIIPITKGIGIVFRKSEKLLFALDYSNEEWSKFKSFGNSDSLVNTSKIAFGAQYLPNPNSTSGFFKKTEYRIGAYYKKLNLNLRGIQLDEKAVTFGFGFPLKKSFSTINIAAEIGSRGTLDQNLIRERFVKVSFGFVLNDRWFVKRKIE